MPVQCTPQCASMSCVSNSLEISNARCTEKDNISGLKYTSLRMWQTL